MNNSLVKGLSQDERDEVADLVRHEGWQPFLKIVAQLVSDQESAVVRLQLSDGVDQLVHAKLKAEGARKLATDVERIKLLFKPEGANRQRPKV